MSREDQGHGEELRTAFLRHLPQRLRTLLRRARRQCRDGWDINALILLQREFATLADAAGRYGLLEIGTPLAALEAALAPYAGAGQLPDAAASAVLEPQLDALREQIEDAELIAAAAPAQAAGRRPQLRRSASAAPADGYARMDVPPSGYWRTLGLEDAPAAAAESRAGGAGSAADAEGSAPSSAPIAAVQPAAAAAPVAGPRVALLAAGDAHAAALRERLQARGCVVQSLPDAEATIEALAEQLPVLLLVAPSQQATLEALAGELRELRGHAQRFSVLALLEHDELAARLRALRAGADHCISVAGGLTQALALIDELLKGDAEEPYRVLIIEDDESQALFAESVLRKAGMLARMVTEPLAALDELERFKPDLILMDLNMPGADGLELTALIRERDAFVTTPIVFLSGDPDDERQFAALDAGGDDFITKPVRPKHLIAAVANRVRRARLAAKRRGAARPAPQTSGLVERTELLDRLQERLATGASARLHGGLLLLEVNDARALRERIGMTAYDALIAQVGSWVAGQVEAHELVARFGDAGLLLLAPERDEEPLAAFAQTLAARIGHERFGGHALALSLAGGACGLACGLTDAGALLAAAERALEGGRREGGVGRYAQLAGNRTLGQQLRSGLDGDGLYLVYQPLAPVSAGPAEAQYQALLRLRDEKGQIVTAAMLVPEAIRSGLIGELDRWVLGRCLATLAARERMGQPVRLFASQALATASDNARAEWLRQGVRDARLPPGRLVLEFRCDEARDQQRTLIDLALALHDIGIGLALSGVGREAILSGLLEQLPLDYVKLAPELARDDGVADLVARAHAAGRRVIAPRIEDAGSAVALCAAGVDYLQGNFVQQPGQSLDYDFSAGQL
ncbi:MAG: EAL domain-containing protein [Xanthomonadaceae bacterium]|nr:EAL domain-containing protein [Xanthomonadaceae bacterium]MDE2178246.1 EAL domain-containing protein [Xanthomonadaceae bacterium]